MVSDPRFSPDGQRLAAVAKNEGVYTILTDDKLWSQRGEMVFPPLFSPDSSHLAARLDCGDGYTMVVNDRLWNRRFQWLWDPVFSPDSKKILIRSVEEGVYHRRVVRVSEIIG
jgi:Tol biopolymer transport system component